MRASLGALVAQADDGATLNSDLASLRHESAPARSDIVGRLREVRAQEGANERSGESTSQSHVAESAAVRTDIASGLGLALARAWTSPLWCGISLRTRPPPSWLLLLQWWPLWWLRSWRWLKADAQLLLLRLVDADESHAVQSKVQRCGRTLPQ